MSRSKSIKWSKIKIARLKKIKLMIFKTKMHQSIKENYLFITKITKNKAWDKLQMAMGKILLKT